MRTGVDRLDCGMCGAPLWTLSAPARGTAWDLRMCPECDKAGQMLCIKPSGSRPVGWFDEGKAS